MNNNRLPSHIKYDTADAYNYAYTTLYCALSKDVRDLIDEAKDEDGLYANLKNGTSYLERTASEFFKEVRRMAQYQPSYEDLKALERREKMEGKHISQQKKAEIPKEEPPKTENPVIEEEKVPESQKNEEEGNAS
jgi:hypothetical protein